MKLSSILAVGSLLATGIATPVCEPIAVSNRNTDIETLDIDIEARLRGLVSGIPDVGAFDTNIDGVNTTDIESRDGIRHCKKTGWRICKSSIYAEIYQVPWKTCAKLLNSLRKNPNKILHRQGQGNDGGYDIRLFNYGECEVSGAWAQDKMSSMTHQDMIDVLEALEWMSAPERANGLVTGWCNGVEMSMAVHKLHNGYPLNPPKQ